MIILKQYKLLRLILILILLCIINVFWPRNPSSLKIDHKTLLLQELSLVRSSHSIIKHYRNNDNIDNKKNAYATFMASSSFFPAFQVFLYSLNKNVISSSTSQLNSNTVIIGMCYKNKAMINATKIEFAKYPNINYEIHIFPTLQRVGSEKDRWAINWSKLFFWSLIDFKVLLYVDLDVIFLHSVDEVFLTPFDKFLGTSDSGRYNPPNSMRINGGVFLMNPSLDVLRGLLTARHSNISDYESDQVEQGLFNLYFKSKCCLPLDFNMQKTTQRYWEAYWNLETIKILHFVGEKPWRSWAHPSLRDNFITRKLRFVGKLRQADSWDADIYQETHNLWKLNYFQARRRTLGKVSLCVGHFGPRVDLEVSNEHYTSLLRYKYIQLDGRLDIKSDFVLQLLKNEKIRNKLGPIATLFTASELIDSEYMGITNMWTEEDSVDWTKVDLRENVIYFWDARYANNYFSDQELLFPGISRVMKDIVAPPPYGNVAPGFFVQGNTIIASRTVIKNLSRDMINILRSFLRKYGTDNCPFQNSADRCIQIFTETYLNIWIAMTKVEKVYAVDYSVLSSQLDGGDNVHEDKNEYFAF